MKVASLSLLFALMGVSVATAQDTIEHLVKSESAGFLYCALPLACPPGGDCGPVNGGTCIDGLCRIGDAGAGEIFCCAGEPGETCTAGGTVGGEPASGTCTPINTLDDENPDATVSVCIPNDSLLEQVVLCAFSVALAPADRIYGCFELRNESPLDLPTTDRRVVLWERGDCDQDACPNGSELETNVCAHDATECAVTMVDGGMLDADVEPVDSGAPDATVPSDAQLARDATVQRDATVEPDASVASDSGRAEDASADAPSRDRPIVTGRRLHGGGTCAVVGSGEDGACLLALAGLLAAIARRRQRSKTT